VRIAEVNISLPPSPLSQKLRYSPEFLPLRPTPVFNAFWAFAAERQSIFLSRQSNPDPPWTTDPILSSFKFTNVYRASDRVSQFDRVLNSAIERGQRIYSAAYIMPPGSRAFKTLRKHVAHRRLLELMLKDDVSGKIAEAQSLESVFRILRSYPLIGDFLAYQYAIDINYSEVINFSESEFVAAGLSMISACLRISWMRRGRAPASFPWSASSFTHLS
jgi:hypothetical protein